MQGALDDSDFRRHNTVSLKLVPRNAVRTSFIAVGALFLTIAAHAEAVAAAPILPDQDRPGAVLRYQAMTPPDRLATLEAFTQQKVPAAKFDTLDACTLRETTEPDATRVKLAKVIADCVKETGF